MIKKHERRFNPGDVAIARRLIRFIYGKIHRTSQRIIVTEDTVSYYNVCSDDYDKE